MIPQPPKQSSLPTIPSPNSTPPSGELELNESTFLLDSLLKPEHREDPQVISFIDAFVKCKNIQQASHEASIPPSLGYRLRHRKDIANAIQRLTDKSAIKYGFDASEVIERVKEVVDFDPIQLQNPDGTYKSNLHDVPPEYRRAIKKMKVRNIWGETEDLNGMKTKIIIGELIEYEFYDKLKAAEMVGKEKKLFKTTHKVEHDVTKDMANVLLESSRRAAERSKSINVIEVRDNNDKLE